MASSSPPDRQTSVLVSLSLASCAAVLGLGYAWVPWPGYGWYVITAAHGVGTLAYALPLSKRTGAPPPYHIPVFLACLTLSIAVLQSVTTLEPSTAANHGWGFGLSTWLVALHALLGLGMHHNAINGASVSSRVAGTEE